jgi:intraflagellar transport protein 88
VNKGNLLMDKGDVEGARAAYSQALAIEPFCVEAIYNVG